MCKDNIGGFLLFVFFINDFNVVFLSFCTTNLFFIFSIDHIYMNYRLSLIASLLFCTVSVSLLAQSNYYRLIDKAWQLQQYGDSISYPIQVPSSVQQELIRLGILPDPFYGTNEQRVQWVEEEDWLYKTTFEITQEDMRHDAVELIFEGLDTYADVVLNGEKIIVANNMFVGYREEVKQRLRVGENKLTIHFKSPIKELLPLRTKTGFEYPADNDHRRERVSVYARKAPYHFGWDWGMRMVQMGIWRDVKLHFYNKAHIADYHIRQLTNSGEQTTVVNEIEIEALGVENATLVVSYQTPYQRTVADTLQNIKLKKGKNTFHIKQQIDSALLWMPREWGEQHRYSFTSTLHIGDVAVGHATRKIGLRSIRLIQEQDSMGRSFYFLVNGIPFFAKGANYIPGDIVTTRQDSAYYEQLFDHIVSANMNMVRVWGGGVYEDDYFYELADRYGILVWQDFMFACTTYPHDTNFLKNVASEAIYNIKRLRHHPSIALWCGNNEISEGMKYWGWEKKYSPTIMENFKVGYQQLFKELLPNTVKQYHPSTDYIHTSPDSANWGRPHTLPYGDAHYWGVWYGREPFEILDKRIPRFMSEFGFQSFPEMKTIRSFSPPSEWSLESATMRTHQKSTTGNDAILEYMKRYYHVPTSFEDFVYVNLIMQGRGMRVGLEAHRRNRPYCMGTLYWQLNDSWPVVSWSGIDYYQNWKALHYHAREVFKPATIEVHQTENIVSFFSLSDRLTAETNCKVKVEIIDFEGRIKETQYHIIDILPNATHELFALNLNDYLPPHEHNKHLLRTTLSDKRGNILTQLHDYFDIPKHLALPNANITTTLTPTSDGYRLTLQTDKLAKDIMVSVPIQGATFSDNFFDLLPHETKKIHISLPHNKRIDPNSIHIKHLRMTYP